MYCRYLYHYISAILTILEGDVSKAQLVDVADGAVHGRSAGAKVLDKLPVPGRPTISDYSRVRAYCTCSRCGLGLLGHFSSHLLLLFSFSPSLGNGPI